MNRTKRQVNDVRCIRITVQAILIAILFSLPAFVMAEDERYILNDHTERLDLYPSMMMYKDRSRTMTPEDALEALSGNEFVQSSEVDQRSGFFKTATWLSVQVENQSDQDDWLIEFAFPLIYELAVYEVEDQTPVPLYETGAVGFPFDHREVRHRHFLFPVTVGQSETAHYLIRAKGGGDLHPPITLQTPRYQTERMQQDLILLGIFYGIVGVMILYNLFLFVSLKIRSYLYYVLAMFCTLMGKISINGVGFQYLWPESPGWNLISTPFWVSLGSIFILLFTRSFLETDRHFPYFLKMAFFLIIWHGVVIALLFVAHIPALNLMIAGALATFVTVLITAFRSLIRGVRQARFFFLGWLIFLSGVTVTILERAAVIPYSLFAEYAGQGAMTAEVVLLSLALADKIQIMREEKAAAEEEARESQQEALENLRKADALKNEFLAVTSHELRTPLYGMIGIAESLKEGAAGEPPEDMKDQLDTIVASGNRLAHLINDILDFSKLKHGSLRLDVKAVDVKHLASFVTAVTGPLIAGKPVLMQIDMPDDLPRVKADPNRIQQVLYNLVGNAIKFTEKGRITLSAKAAGKFVTVRVSDTGIGIPKQERDAIFDPFVQVDQLSDHRPDGTGIGLTITKQLLELHDSRLEVDTDTEEGASFFFALPIHQESEDVREATEIPEVYTAPPAERNTQRYTVGSAKARILIADDEPVNLQVLTNQLSLEGYETHLASSGEEVLDFIAAESFDLIILDLMMPGISGYEVCVSLREDFSLVDLPILMLTAKSGLDDKVIAFEAGANDYLVKPCERLELTSRVRTLIRIKKMNEELKALNVELEEKVAERTKALGTSNEALTRANKSLVAAEDARKQLLSNIAHELGTPVALIHSYMQSVRAGLIAMDDPYYHQQVEKKIQILNRLISDLFDLARFEQDHKILQRETFSVSDWLTKVDETCRFEVTQHHRRYEGPEIGAFEPYKREWYCHVDVERMDQVLSNLIVNSVKFTTEDDGTIRITAEWDLNERKLVIGIHDNGAGIPKEAVPFMFDRFYRAGDHSGFKPKGSGLGLAIVKQIIESHGGEVDVTSEQGKGTSFFITVPMINRRELKDLADDYDRGR
ncbi:ATP-binding protein [Salisediminibacterium selenitireducens]|uniref:histidine kinase n=1 Tax=Bacillus selenitireducens (strain ATCC 700615 / DSM 15326 / MLS10) TaxID=439292 RepID=D6Y0P1_BACIE|nr:ATP-binding protein [Salisediminibacterium selenitireducens]ADI00609.1 response regulator receiver [[Bacillus] selenitireducens MLS10]